MKKKEGFTLLEILVVVLIITILATVVGVNVLNKPGEARVAVAKAQIKELQTALQLYRMDNGSLPTPQQGLAALCNKPDVPPLPAKYREEGYLEKRKLPLDPWGNAYIYLIPGRNQEAFEILSYGSDGEPGGAGEKADVSSSE